jgi:GT2 family glycosyltransferase
VLQDVGDSIERVEGQRTNPSLRVQVVLYLHHPGTAMRVASSLAASVRVAKDCAALGLVELCFGDSSPASFTDAQIAEIEEYARHAGFDATSYAHFDANLGSAGGSNRLAKGASADFLLVLNPDTYASPGLLAELLEAATEPGVGAVDARQIPLEHPKRYDLASGDTSWASGACMLIRRAAFVEVGGFDDTHFFLHCDDVDLSWRLRLAGWRVRHAPTAVVFHDKRIAGHGSIEPSETEVYHSLRGRLLLARRFGTVELEADTIAAVERHGNEAQKLAVADFLRQLDEGAVPERIEGAERVAQFIDGEYAEHRF